MIKNRMVIQSVGAIIATLTSSFFTSSGQAQIGNPNGWSIVGTDPVVIQFAGRHVATYNPGLNEGKPFFYPLYGPTGENMTRHWPMIEAQPGEATDHIHHRGLWFGLGSVNGLDFWHFPGGKKGKFGRVVHQGLNKTRISGDQITFGTKSDWVNDETRQLVCQDTREFMFQYDADGSLMVDVSITLIASNGDVLIKDDKEGFCAIRVPATMGSEGKVAQGGMLDSENREGKEVWGKRARWVYYYGPDAKGSDAGIAMFDHPGNPRYPTWWHARGYGLFAANPFGESHFDGKAAKDAGDFTIKTGASVTFRYRFLFHKGAKGSVDLEAVCKAFSEKN